MKQPEYIHTPSDGRGIRTALLDGKPLAQCVYANTRAGVVRVLRSPLKLDKHKKRLLMRTLRGCVEVVFPEGPAA